MNQQRDGFSSKFGVIAAAAGSAIGLGNIWRFPYVAGENGGCAFLLIYLFFICFIGMPIMLTELSLGRMGGQNAIGTLRKLSPKGYWHWVGAFGVLAAFMIFSFYSAVAGWTIKYTWLAITDQFVNKDAASFQTMFNDFVGSPFESIIYSLSFVIATSIIVALGIEKGIEKYSKILMPILFVIILVLDVNALMLPGGTGGLKFLFEPDFSKITLHTVLEALGQAFFSLSIGIGVIMTYGSYVKKKEDLAQTTFSVSMSDTAIAILSGVAIFPAVFAFGIKPDAGEQLVYISLPNIFPQMFGGYILGVLFFVLLVIASLTSSVSQLEVVVAYIHEEFKMSRKKAVMITTFIALLTASLCTVSSPFGYFSKEITIWGVTIFDIFNFVSSTVIMPLGGLCLVLLAGWVMPLNKIRDEVFINRGKNQKAWWFSLYIFIVRFVAPIAIAIIFITGMIGGLK